ncbi:MAG: amidase [Rhodospirillaceae bacterium]|nr:amidase [Rhodospirillaceae bacterium]
MNADTHSADLAFQGIATLGEQLAAGAISSRGLTELYLQRIALHDPKINSYISVLADHALAAAEASDGRRRSGKTLGPLDGIPIALKDNIDLSDVPTTAGIEARRNHIATTDATVTARLKAAGAVILGKLNMHEGAHGATTANEAYGFCYNPHREGFTPGGSSGGSGAALAAGLCAGALGSDTLGSIRIPSSFCGSAGIKPTHGAVSTHGVVPLAFALDHVGPMGRCAADLAIMLEVLAAPDARDPVSAMAPRALHAVDATPRSLKGLRLGRLPNLDAFAADTVNPDIAQGYEAALNVLRELGATIVDVELVGYRHNAIRPKAMLMIEADLAVIYAEELEKNPAGFSTIFRDGVAFGRQQSAPKLAAALETIRAVKPIANELFSKVDALVTPTTPCTAFSFKEAMPKTLTAFTAFANYAGAPAASVPMGLTRDKLPMGLQIIARPWHDMTALRIAGAYERVAQWNLRPAGF